MKLKQSARIEMTGHYLLRTGARVIARAPDSVQIGIEVPRRVIVRDAPPNTGRVLAGFDGSSTVAEILAANNADPVVWRALLDQLLDAELLLPLEHCDRPPVGALPSAHLAEERSGLAVRHGDAAAGRIMQARDDALVVIRGRIATAGPFATMLATAGIGHLHLEQGGPTVPARSRSGPPWGRTGSRWGELSAELRGTFPHLRVHPPAAHQYPTLVVLYGEPMPDLAVAATYTRNLIPHLQVVAGATRAVVGPMVLPGRSSCLSCAHRHRTASDPGWPTVAKHLADDPPCATAFLTAAATCLAVGEVLDHIDGVRTPNSVNGTLEWHAGATAPRRRSWAAHPDCGCHCDPTRLSGR